MGLAVLVLAFVVLGPRPGVDEPSAGLPSVPEDVDGWLAERESRFPDLVPGAEKVVRWADPAVPAPTPLAVVYLHGFSATRQEVRPVAEEVAEALGANLFLTRLRGHGRGAVAMGEARAGDWLDDALEAFAVGRKLGRRVVLIGTSTGGTLATWLAARPELQPDLEALVLLSPNFGPADPASRVLLWPWGGVVARVVEGRERSWEAVNEEQARFWTTRYPTGALLPMMALVDRVKALDLGTITTPTLFLYGPTDQVVSLEAMHAAYGRFGAPRRAWVAVEGSGDPSGHILAGDILSPATTGDVVARIVAFVNGVGQVDPGDR